MDLVEIHDRLAVLERRHHRHEPVHLAAVDRLDQQIPQLRRVHLLPLGCGVPTDRRLPVILAARLLDQVEAGLQVGLVQLRCAQEIESVFCPGLGVAPARPAVTVLGEGC